MVVAQQERPRVRPSATTAPDAGPPAQPPAAAGITTRILSIDALRGFVMFLMLAEAMHLMNVRRAFPGNRFWEFVAFNTTHVPWQGCSLHDLIQPAFSFLVGAAMAFSIVSRTSRGESWNRMLLHAMWRSVALIFLGIFLRSLNSGQTYWTFEDTLTQIGLGYTFLFLLAFTSLRVQIAGLRCDPRRLLAGVRALSIAAGRLRLHAGGGAGRLAASLLGLPRALQQELEPVVGVRRLVPQPVPARQAVPLQRRRLVHAELHPDAGDDDARPVGGPLVDDVADDDRKAEGPGDRRRRADAGRPHSSVAAHQPDHQAHLDIVLHAVQRRTGRADAGGVLRR